MNQNKKRHISFSIKPSNQTKGFSLVELMVGMTIGLFVASIAVGFLVSSSRSLSQKTGLDLVQENTRFALEVLSTNVRLAGLVNTTNLDVPDAIDPVFTRENICTAGATSYNTAVSAIAAGVCNVDNQDYTAANVYSSDRIAIESVTSDSFLACSGNLINPADTISVVTVFWVGDTDGDGVSSLYCQTYTAQFNVATKDFDAYQLNGATIPIIDGIEMLQVQYGVDTDEDGDIDTFQSFPYLTVAPGSAQTDNILAIKFGLLVSPGQSITSEQNADGDAAVQKTYRVLDGYFQTPDATDRVFRQVTSFTIFLPNMAS